jgi:hypothetical protein
MVRAGLPPVYFPTTPHLKGSCGTDDDTFMDAVDCNRVLFSHVLVQEKLDGVNIGLTHTPDGSLLVIAKDKIISPNHFTWLAPLWEWYDNKRSDISEVLDDQTTLFGEYIPDLPSSKHQPLPWFLLDAFDRRSGRFLAQHVLQTRTIKLGLPHPQTLFSGVPRSISTIKGLIGESCIRPIPMEGVSIRIEGGLYLKERYKFVRQGFVKSVW